MRRRAILAGLAGLGLSLGVATPGWAAAESGTAPREWLVLVAALAAGLAAFLIVVILSGRSPGREARLRGRLGAYGSSSDRGGGGVFARFRVLRRVVREAEGVARERGMLQTIETALEQANMPVRPGEAIVGAIGLSLIGGILVGTFGRSVLWGLLAAVLMLGFAAFSVSTIASRERKRFESQLPDTLNLIATSLRAGYSLLQAVEAVGQESPEPTAREFARAITEIRLGRSVDAALNDVARRMESQDFEWAVLAINIQREVGGNLAEVLQTTAETMLQRNRLRREMKALTAEGRISAIVLGALPFVIFGVILVVNPTYIAPLLGTTQGLVALGVAAVLLVLGMVWLQKIVKVEV